MAKGGARARSGPPPDPAALRRDRPGDKDEWVTLPAEGRKGRAPAWPLSRATRRETEIWLREWKRPQAVMWERNGQHLEVALYVRRLVEAEQRLSAVNLSTLVRQLMDSLGLTSPGMRANRWRIAVDEVAARRQDRAATGPSRAEVRELLKAGSGATDGA